MKLPDRERCLTDLSYLCRKVLGMDYWKDYKTGELIRGRFEWEGHTYHTTGLVDWGPYGQMQDFIQDPHPDKLILCSRGGLKTSWIQGKIIQRILQDPNIRILIGMEKFHMAKMMIRTVKAHFERNEILRELFGDLVGKKWTDEGFIIANRTQTSLRDDTLHGFGVDRHVTGGHYDEAYIDDLVSWLQARNKEQLEKAIAAYTALVPVMDPGSKTVVTMTPYDENDFSFYLRNELSDRFKVLEIDCGMRAVLSDDGGVKLEGKPKFPHMPAGFLEGQLERMGAQDFNAQYALTIENPEDQIFFREQFGTASWQPHFSRSNAYILTDTATSDQDHGCFSVIALVIVDHDDTAYIADMRIGKWVPEQFVHEFCDVVEHWRPRTRLMGAVMEGIGLNRVFRVPIDTELRMRGLSIRFIKTARGAGEPSKNQRIKSLTSRLAADRLKILSTVPTNYGLQGKNKLLWDPLGFNDTRDHKAKPAGELVDQFIRFRSSGSSYPKDIPDALADLEAVDASGRRVIKTTPPQIAKQTYGNRMKNKGKIPSPFASTPTKRDFWDRTAQNIRNKRGLR